MNTATTARERELLLATKLAPPRVPPELVARPRLVDALERARRRDLTLVSSPAGFGKTTLLVEWGRRSKGAVVWLSLDPDDNDPARFWRYLVAAIGRKYPELGGRLGAMMDDLNGTFAEWFVAAAINELADVPDDLAVVLDDYHLVTSHAVHESVTFLLEHLPPQLRLVISTRIDPPFPLGRFRARGQLAELRAADLRFTPAEAGTLLRDVWHLDLPDQALEALEARTEGWAASLQLAALSLQGRSDAGQFMDALGDSRRYVLDYLTEEVLERQPPQVRDFLLATSVLDRLTGSLCDALTDGDDGQETLETLERRNLFLVPLDEVKHWYRYHHLFADLLRVRLRASDQERVRALHERAATWFEQHGLIDEAVHHALAQENPLRAARLVEQHVEELLRRSERTTLRRWLAALPEEVVHARARLSLAQAFGALLANRIEAVEALVADAEQAEASEPHHPSIEPVASVLANVPGGVALLRSDVARVRGDAAGIRRFAEHALSVIEPERWLVRSLGEWNLVHADWLEGRLDRAERGLERVVGQRRAAGETYLSYRAAFDLGRVQQAQGRLRAALATYRGCLQLDETAGRPQLPAASMMHLGIAEVLLEQDEREAALGHAEIAVSLAEHLAFVQAYATSLATLARARQAMGDAAAARETMEQAFAAGPRSETCDIHSPVGAERACLLIGQGDVAEAAQWATGLGLAATDEPSYPMERRYLALSAVLLAERSHDAALALLERLQAAAARDGRIGSMIPVLVLKARALAGLGTSDAALGALTEALALARPEGYVRTFTDGGREVATLLPRLANGPHAEYARRLLRAFDAPVPGPASPAWLREPLTVRELEVLELLAAGRSNREMAAELVVTLDTVKKHITHILGKLGAANRTQAAARGREAGLIA